MEEFTDKSGSRIPSTATGLIYKSKFKVDTPTPDGWLNRFGKFTPNESHHHVEVALDFIASNDCLDDFMKQIKNKGFDAGEYLIITGGYIAIESNYVCYRSSGDITKSQLRSIGCYIERNVIKKKVLMSAEDKKKHDDNIKKLREEEIQRIKNHKNNGNKQ